MAVGVTAIRILLRRRTTRTAKEDWVRRAEQEWHRRALTRLPRFRVYGVGILDWGLLV